MVGIGEYAGITGLSVKALRHYDEKGVLVPAEVDERSSYRRYADAQVRAGVVISALRSAGVPLPEVAAATRAGTAAATRAGTAAEALLAHRERVLAEREQEDRAFEAAEVTLRALAVPVEVAERTMPAQPYVGQVLTIALDEADGPGDDEANEILGVLAIRVHAAVLGPTGRFWTALRAGEPGSAELVCCWPTSAEAEGDLADLAAILPARTELVATWRPRDGEELPEGTLHPAIVALFDAAGDRGLRLDGVEVRQTVLGEGPEDVAVEVSLTVAG
ncbi:MULTISPECIES: MerR family transcriptional regulator [unclassified Rathayibacter]|uniref:MerR family transcriptional regulator n=2 Tax=Rathayibacter TaxID=33886 RepID=UPI000CE7D647|nr:MULTISPECIES: MerR family transcriptional regulator [unclassified Rathayibacter]PPH18165.1 MerR family transcriptional regulator [Rathayibacter sp. AY1F8]PPH90220.1 MerR family transcriptional regulator [Rathayibacter sp. AY1D3]